MEGEAEVDDDDDDDDEEEKAKKKKKKGPSVGRLLALSRPERGLIVAGTVALLLSSLSTMILPAFIGRLIDDVGGQGGGTCVWAPVYQGVVHVFGRLIRTLL